MLNNYKGNFLSEFGSKKLRKDRQPAQSESAKLGDAIHNLVQSEMAHKGQLYAAEAPVVDMQHKMVSQIDAISKDGEIIEIKSIALSEIYLMRKPRPEHKAQLVYYLQTTGSETGVILYVARDAPGVRKAFRVNLDGESEITQADSIAYMSSRRGGVSASKMQRALAHAVSNFKTPDHYIKKYDEIVSEVRQLRKRRFNQLKQAAFNRAYDQATIGTYEAKLLNTHGLSQGPQAKALKQSLTEFSSPYQGKKKRRVTLSKKPGSGFKRTPASNEIRAWIKNNLTLEQRLNLRASFDPMFMGPEAQKKLGVSLVSELAKNTSEAHPGIRNLGQYLGDNTSVSVGAGDAQRFGQIAFESLNIHSSEVSPQFFQDYPDKSVFSRIASDSRKPQYPKGYLPSFNQQESLLVEGIKRKRKEIQKTFMDAGLFRHARQDMFRNIKRGDWRTAVSHLDAVFNTSLLSNTLQDSFSQSELKSLGPLYRHLSSDSVKLELIKHGLGIDLHFGPDRINARSRKVGTIRRGLRKLYAEEAENKLIAAEAALPDPPVRSFDLDQAISGYLDEIELPGKLGRKINKAGALSGQISLENYLERVRSKMFSRRLFLNDMETFDDVREFYKSDFDTFRQDLALASSSDSTLISKLKKGARVTPTTGLNQDQIFSRFRLTEMASKDILDQMSQEHLEKKLLDKFVTEEIHYPPVRSRANMKIVQDSHSITQSLSTSYKGPAVLPPPKLSKYKSSGEMGLDIEAFVRPEGSRLRYGRIREIGTTFAIGNDSFMSIPKGLGHDEFLAEINQRQITAANNASLYRAKFLDFKAAEEIMNSSSIYELIKKGHMEKKHLADFRNMARRTGFVDARGNVQTLEYLQAEVADYLRGSSETVGGKRELYPTFKRALGAATPDISKHKDLRTDRLHEWILDERRALKALRDDFSRNAKRTPGGHFYLMGHNIGRFDMENLDERLRIHGEEQFLKGNKFTIDKATYEVLDTLTGPLKENVSQHLDDELTSALRIGGKSRVALENQAKSFGLVAKGAEKYAHSAIPDVVSTMSLAAVQARGSEDFIKEGISNFRRMALGEIDEPARRVASTPNIYEEMATGSIQQLEDGRKIELPRSKPKKASTTSLFKKQLEGITDELLGHGTYKSTGSVLESAYNYMDDLTSKARPVLDEMVSVAGEVAEGLGISSKHKIRGRGMAMLGGAFLLGAAGLSFATTSIVPNQLSHRPIKHNPIQRIPLSGNDEEHRMERYTGPQASYMRASMTDFGSGYRGAVGSRLVEISMAKNTPVNKITTTLIPKVAPNKSIGNLATKYPNEVNGTNLVSTRKPNSDNIEVVFDGNQGVKNYNLVDQDIMMQRQRRVRKAKFRALGNQGTRPHFEMNERRTGHTRYHQ